MRLTLRIWRQRGRRDPGRFVRYEVDDASPDMSFLELLDEVNDRLVREGGEPIAFDSDCREGICGTCGFVIDGLAQGPLRATTVCQLHLRHFEPGQELVVEPFRAAAFPIVKDLVVERAALDRIVEAGGYVSVDSGSAPDANTIPVATERAERALDAAACIGCGACVAACPNASAMLFTAAKVSHLALLPQGEPERTARAWRMTERADALGFGACGNTYDCEAACPKQISVQFIAKLYRERARALAARP